MRWHDLILESKQDLAHLMVMEQGLALILESKQDLAHLMVMEQGKTKDAP